MSTKERLSASVDADLLALGHAAVAQGQAANISVWVNGALRRQVEYDRRMQALDAFLSAYEAEHGAITDEDIRSAARKARSGSLVEAKRQKASKPARVTRSLRGAA